jgi:hypothetical protein
VYILLNVVESLEVTMGWESSRDLGNTQKFVEETTWKGGFEV